MRHSRFLVISSRRLEQKIHFQRKTNAGSRHEVQQYKAVAEKYFVRKIVALGYVAVVD